MANLRIEEERHIYPADFMEKEAQENISERYRQYLVDWLAELHYKFQMRPETLYVTIGVIDKTLMKWKHF